ncbi:WD40 repeat domain-containing protein [Myxococcus sp. NMCA1]|uniref:WD40 repeat domain-containing protein n=1 Tax=Myxococcus sp. NMCA1 TaxID=2996785 RepID=UPI00228687F5|nr:WD40 repeat domain-containing protein [Myxococcus sp. NMCA1]WAM24289.1 WD40 repeat domain-containing protein [Myxococcus sp. NMCA1]
MRIGHSAVLALVVLGACSEGSPPSTPDPIPVPPVSSAAPFRPCGAIGAGALVASAMSPDGTVLAAATLSGQLVLYRRDGSRLSTLWDLPGQQVGVAFSKDGRILAAASRTQTRVWSFPDLAPVRTFAHPHAGRTTSVALSADGAFIATGGFDSPTSETAIVKIWSVADGGMLGSWQRQYEQVVQSLSFSPDGAGLAIALRHSVWVVGVPAAGEPRSLPNLSGGQVSWSADGALLASGGRVVRADTGVVVKPSENSLLLDASAFSPDGRFYAEAAEAGVTVYRVEDWTKLHVFPRQGASRVSRLGFSRDGTELILDLGVDSFWCNGSGQSCGPWGNEVVIQSLQDLGLVRTLSLGPQMRGRVAFSPDGSLLAGNADGVLGVWRTADLSAVEAPAVANPWRIQFSPDLRKVRVDAAIYDSVTGQRLQPFLDQALSADFSVSARIEGRKLFLNDVATGRFLRDVDVEEDQVIGFSPDGRFIATNQFSGRNRIWLRDVATGTVSETFDQGFNAGGPDPSFSPNGRWLGSADGTGFSSVEVLGLQGWVSASLPRGFASAFSPDSSVLALGNVESEVLLWKTSDFTVRERLSGHGTSIAQEQWPQSIIGVVFARTGQLATLGADRTVRLWCSP